MSGSRISPGLSLFVQRLSLAALRNRERDDGAWNQGLILVKPAAESMVLSSIDLHRYLRSIMVRNGAAYLTSNSPSTRR
jgi:hypothetical protein